MCLPSHCPTTRSSNRIILRLFYNYTFVLRLIILPRSQQACKLYCKFFFMNLIKIIIVTLLSEGEERKKKEEIRYSNVNYQS